MRSRFWECNNLSSINNNSIKMLEYEAVQKDAFDLWMP